jgi:uncharacterized ferredoxin-like protein
MEIRILKAIAEHARTNPKIHVAHSLIVGMHETELAEKTGIRLDELMTIRYDEHDRVRRSGPVQTLSAKLLLGLTDGDPKDRFGFAWLTPAGLQASLS